MLSYFIYNSSQATGAHFAICRGLAADECRKINSIKCMQIYRDTLRIRMHLHVNTYMYICMYVCIYAYIEGARVKSRNITNRRPLTRLHVGSDSVAKSR